MDSNVICSKLNPLMDSIKRKTASLVMAGHAVRVIYHDTAIDTVDDGITKISADHYIVDETGEVKDYQHSSSRAQNVAGLRRTMSACRDLINANFDAGTNAHWITLTYAENMMDPRQLKTDVNNFFKRLRYYCGKNHLPEYGYIIVAEPQARGAWHVHLLLKWFSDYLPFIANSVLADIWGNGFVKINRMPTDGNIANYLVAYLSDLPFDEFCECYNRNPDAFNGLCVEDINNRVVEKMVTNADGDSVPHKFVKAARLWLYPTGMRYYRHSRNLSKPVRVTLSASEAEHAIASAYRNSSGKYSLVFHGMYELLSLPSGQAQAVPFSRFEVKSYTFERSVIQYSGATYCTEIANTLRNDSNNNDDLISLGFTPLAGCCDDVGCFAPSARLAIPAQKEICKGAP